MLFRWCAWWSKAAKPVVGCMLQDYLTESKETGQEVLWAIRTYIIYWIFIKWHRHQWKIPSASLDFTLSGGQNWPTSKFTWHCCFPLSHPLIPLLGVIPSLIEGIRKTQLILSSLNTRFTIKIILVNICTEENKRALTRPLRFLHYKL